MESPTCNLIELLICKLLYWTLFIWHFDPIWTCFTILTMLTIFDHFDLFFKTCPKNARKLPKAFPKLAKNCQNLAILVPVIFDIIDHYNIYFLICMPIINSLAWIDVCLEHRYTWRMLIVPGWTSGGMSHIWCEIWHNGSQ